MLRKSMFELSNCHVVMTNVSREKEFSMLHGAVMENEVECKEAKAGVCRKSRVLITHEVSCPFIDIALSLGTRGHGVARDDIGKSRG